MQVGSQDQPSREIIWYLAKVVPDVERNEPRNVGLILRLAELQELHYRFAEGMPFSGCDIAQLQAYKRQVTWWTETMDKYGARCLFWITKPKDGGSDTNTRFYLEKAGAAVRPGRVNFDALYKRLVE